MGYVALGRDEAADSPRVAMVMIAGIVVSYLWYRIVRSYRDLNSAKFRMIHEIEKLLPTKPYDAEWEAVGRGEKPKLYLPFTHVEIFVPWIFMALHSIVLARVGLAIFT
jgi:hypothetical protein